MKNKFVVIINSLKVPKSKKILLYEMKFLVPNYSCLQNFWLVGYLPQIPVLSILCPQLILLNPPAPARIKFLGTPQYSTISSTPNPTRINPELKSGLRDERLATYSLRNEISPPYREHTRVHYKRKSNNWCLYCQLKEENKYTAEVKERVSRCYRKWCIKLPMDFTGLVLRSCGENSNVWIYNEITTRYFKDISADLAKIFSFLW